MIKYCFTKSINYLSNRPQVSMGYLVNKPLRAAAMSADNVRGWEIIFGQEAKLRGQIWNFEDNLSAKHQPTYRQARKGFIYFVTLPLIFISYLNRSLKTSVDPEDEWARLLRAS